jgi:RNA polymerase sigma-70 factor (ECF subfamily)
MMRERTEFIRQALQTLPKEQREAIEIAYFGGRSQSEIAAQLNVPLGTVKTRMRQGMKKLQTQLMEQTE